MTNQIVELAREFHALKTKHEELTKQLKDLDEVWNSIEAELMEAMVEEGVSTIKVEGAGKFTLASEHYFSATAEKKPEFFKYLKENGHGALIKEDVNARTLGAFAKNLLTETSLQLVRTGLPATEAEKTAIEKLQGLGLSYFRKRTIRTQRS